MRTYGIFLATILSFLATFAAGQGKGCPAPQPMSNMRLTFDSEFAQDGTLNPQQWVPYVGQHGPVEQESNVYLPENVSVIPKVGLQIEIAKRNYWDHHYTSGWIQTQGHFAQTYGHFEMLAKMPQGNGVWPAFWLASENGGWPPEIDVVEYVFAPRGVRPDRSAKEKGSVPETTLHWADPTTGEHKFMHAGWGSDQPKNFVYDLDKAPPLTEFGSAYAGYHLYAIDWRPGSVVWLFDHKPVFCMTDDGKTGERVPHVPMYVILSASVAPEVQPKPHWAGMIEPTQTFPLEFDVAYTRAYQFKDIHNEHQLALDIRNVTVSNAAPKPGDTITVSATLRVGPSNLGQGKLEFAVFTFLDIKQFYGIGPRLGTVAVQVPNLAAGQSYNLKANITLPRDMQPGYYGVDAKATYLAGPGNDLAGPWPRGIHYREALTLAVHH